MSELAVPRRRPIRVTVLATVCGRLAWCPIPHDNPTITHVPSGRLLVEIVAPREDAFEAFLLLARLPWPRRLEEAKAFWEGLGPDVREATRQGDVRRLRQLLGAQQ